MNRKPNPDNWKKLDLNDDDAAGMAWNRLQWLMRYDPFTSMLTEQAINSLCNLFFCDEVFGASSINITWQHEVRLYVIEALNRSAFAKMFSDDFKSHLISLVQTAIFAGKVDNPYPLG